MPTQPRPRPRPAFGSSRPRPPQTEASRRAADIKAKRRAAEGTTPARQPAERGPEWAPDEWHDHGSSSDPAPTGAAGGAGTGPGRERRSGDPSRLDPQWVEDVQRESDARTSARYMERLASATEALDRERFGDALRMVQPVLKNLPNVGAAHEVAGVALYRLGQWRKAAAELEQARALRAAPEQLPLLADCYRALGKFRAVDEIWLEIRETSPAQDVMAEGRIVMAGALADQGDLAGAIKLLLRVADAPKKVREYHLKQWYVLADLYDRSGDVVRARNFFKRVAAVDPRYADVADRISHLGRR